MSQGAIPQLGVRLDTTECLLDDAGVGDWLGCLFNSDESAVSS